MPTKRKRKQQSLFDQISRDKSGNIVILQFPNWPLLIAFALLISQSFAPVAWLPTLYWGEKIALFYWAFLEITQGVNTWRNFLGWVVALWIVFGTLTTLTI